MSLPPALVSEVPEKAAVAWKEPVTKTLPPLSTATLAGTSSPAPPPLRTHSGDPVAEYFATKISLDPVLIRTPPPKSADVRKLPVTSTFPLLSTATLAGCTCCAVLITRDQR